MNAYPFQTTTPESWQAADAAMWLLYELTESVSNHEVLIDSQTLASAYIDSVHRLQLGTNRYEAKLAACRRLLLGVR